MRRGSTRTGADEVFTQLVLARIIEPPSLRSTAPAGSCALAWPKSGNPALALGLAQIPDIDTEARDSVPVARLADLEAVVTYAQPLPVPAISRSDPDWL
jgi:hypothetical protein